MPRFSAEEIRRYGRQILLREVGGHGQERLRAAQVRLDGSGPILTTAARYLLRAGIGVLSLYVPAQAEAAALSATLADDAPPSAVLQLGLDPDASPGARATLAGGRTVTVTVTTGARCQGAAGEIVVACRCQPPPSLSAGAGQDPFHALAGPLLGAQLALVVQRLILQMDPPVLAPGVGGARLAFHLDPLPALHEDREGGGDRGWAPFSDCTCAAPPPEASYLPS